MMLNPILIKNIITDNERKELVSWMLSSSNQKFFFKSVHPGTIRQTTRYSKNVLYPSISFEIKNRIVQQFNLKNFLVPNEIPSGMVASFGMPGDCCDFHTDQVWYQGYTTFHFVTLLQSPDSGGNPIINNIEYTLEECDGIFYPVSELSHGTTLITGIKERLIWIFCFCIKDNFRPVAQLVRAGDS